MTSYLTAFVLIGVLLVVGVLIGAGLVLVSWLREREERAVRDEPPPTERDRAA
jgi:hypothetical protein